MVEGDADNKFYALFVDKKKCEIIIAFNKSLAIQVISILEGGFSKFISKDAFTVDGHELIQAVKNKSRRSDILEAHLKASIQALQDDSHDPWQVCCGHDLIYILSRELHGAISRGKNNAKNADPAMLEISLRLAFEHAYFYQTHLYLSILAWEKANAPYIILAAEQP